jgi:hypothetical protein
VGTELVLSPQGEIASLTLRPLPFPLAALFPVPDSMSSFGNMLPVLMAALLAAGSVASGTEQAGLASSATDRCPVVEEHTLPEGDLEGIPLDARITKITSEQGLLELETDLGTLQAVSAPEKIRDLKAEDTSRLPQ